MSRVNARLTTESQRTAVFGTCLICNDMFQTLLPYAFFDLATQSSAQLYLNILHPGPSQ